ncbi:TauD/TfdA dioxygenase family protein [Novosphingobium album (ex Liu et al. 2023)]|uniref:TauD/TfdA family dioxygenase n=1 Tax=Novosphingobium album (ex Liu et al. 2023) TaxID=3031130 RepID=A0ABT5WRF2_9SPHN|nr:TauD/TfdA family dioxygenase [Novosphingobium album (ex Liu et al. 2023)]MDE8651568.1 TauD/TfdA family dioxygenase [Novosphingobium album (ex Liu et al. 2023)]
MAGITVRDLDDTLSFGAQVSGLGWSNIEDESIRQQLRDLFVDRGMIVFRGMEPSARMQVALSKVFGPLKDHPTKSTPRDKETGDEAEGVIDMHYVPRNENPEEGEGLVEYQGEVLARFSPWHFDHCYNDELNYAGVLRSPIAAPVGGRTGFMDGIELYRQFPRGLRDRLEGRNVIYTLDTRLSKQKYGVNFTPLTEHASTAALLKEVAIFPRAMHPAIWERQTGEKVLHFGPWMAVALEHEENAAGDALLDEVAHEINRLGEGTSAYWHDWSPTDMVIWDNHRMLHAVEGCNAKYERQTLRTTIKGDYGLGYFEDGKKIGEVFREVA